MKNTQYLPKDEIDLWKYDTKIKRSTKVVQNLTFSDTNIKTSLYVDDNNDIYFVAMRKRLDYTGVQIIESVFLPNMPTYYKPENESDFGRYRLRFKIRCDGRTIKGNILFKADHEQSNIITEKEIEMLNIFYNKVSTGDTYHDIENANIATADLMNILVNKALAMLQIKPMYPGVYIRSVDKPIEFCYPTILVVRALNKCFYLNK